MEEQEIINLWKNSEARLNQLLELNKKLLREIINQKAQTAMNSLAKFKTKGIIAAVIYLIILGLALSVAIINYSSAVNYFIVSIGAIFLINLKALYDYIKHLVWIKDIDYDGNVMEIQSKLVKLKLSIFAHSRIIVLQLPFWTTFCLSDKWFPQSAGLVYIIFQIVFTASFTYLAYWLYKNQTVENADKKWFKILIAGSGGKSLMKAMEMYKELEGYKAG
jgi:lysylphosphatidylglycerol synthetase-like protein (DUF2156 family)